jgi:dynein heavy chain
VTNEAPKFSEVFQDTDYKTPMIFVLSPGSDPLQNLQRFADEISAKMLPISLGQGQGKIAMDAILEAKNFGTWVLLQNCHLSKTFMPELELLIEKLNDCRKLDPKNNEEDRVEKKIGDPLSNDVVHENFRLFLTSMPCDYFPITILQNGVKLTNEPPRGLKANILKTFNEFSENKFENMEEGKRQNFKNMTFCLSIYHAIILERRKFGPLGYNILYDFNESDLETTLRLLEIMLKKYSDVPWAALKYLTAEINYGGRVTDDWDRRNVTTILEIFFNDECLNGGYRFTSSPIYSVPEASTLPQLIDIIKEYPEIDPCAIFGMSSNAEVSYQLKESRKALDLVLKLQGIEIVEKKSGERTPDDIVLGFIASLQTDKYPQQILKEGETKAEVRNFDDPLDVCLVAETERFNRLLRFISAYIQDLEKAVKGEMIMTEELESTYQAILKNQIPNSWREMAYPSLKDLASWYQDLLERVEFFRNWYINGKPTSYNLPAFYFPQGFLTSVLQFHSRATKIAIDKLSFDFEFKNIDPSTLTQRPETGCYIRGLYMEGCRYEFTKNILVDNPPGVMITPSPLIYFIPKENFVPNPNAYSMPCYKTSTRAGTMSAVGQSTNFVLTIFAPTKVIADYWILNGAAFLCDSS